MLVRQPNRGDENGEGSSIIQIVVLSIALALCANALTTIRAQSIASTVQKIDVGTNTPDGVVRQFHAWYLGELRDGKQPYKNKEELKLYATDQLIAEVGERANDSRFDPMLFFPSSDPSWHDMKVTTARPKYYRKNSKYDASVVVTYKGQSNGKRFSDSYIIDLSRTSAGWRISSIVSKD